MWHLISFAVSVLSLSLWFYFQDQRRGNIFFRTLFVVSFSLFLVSTFLESASWANKIKWLVQDSILLAAIGAFLGMLRAWKILFWSLLAVSLFLVFTKWRKPEATNILLSPDGEWLIQLESNEKLKDIQNNFPALDFRPAFTPKEASSSLSTWWVVDIPNWYFKNLKKLKEKIAQHPDVVAVEENEVILVAPLSKNNIQNTNRKFAANDPGLDKSWGFEAMEVDELYNFLKNNDLPPQKKARVAILDTGVDALHEDLRGNYYSTNTKYDTDLNGHGTHCAGIAAAVTNNGLGIASYALNNNFVEVTSIKVLANFGGGTQETIIDGMIEAADQGADVISMSLGARTNDTRQNAYQQAVQYCNRKGAIVIVSAGNSNTNAKWFSPANTPGVIAVSAVDVQLNRASFSNFVSDLQMKVAAPGVNIYSTTPKNTYNTFSGTSMAAPYVAGLVGLLKSLNPDLTTSQVYQILNRTGKNTSDTDATGKLIHPLQAIQALD